MKEKPKTIPEKLLQPVVNLFVRINKRLRFSITFKTTALYALNFFMSLLRFGIVLLLCFAVYLAFCEYRDLARVGTVIGGMLSAGELPREEIKKIAEASDCNVAIEDSEGTIIYMPENQTGLPETDASQFWRYGNLPWFKENMPYAFYIDLTGKMMSVRADRVSEPIIPDESNNTDEQGNPDGSGNILSGSVTSGEAGDTTGDPNLVAPAVPEPSLLYTVLVFRSIEWEWATLQAVTAGMGILFVLTLFGTARKGARQTGRMLSPIHDMTQAARSISYHELHTRLNPINTHDELKELAETFNEMLDRIQASSIMQNRFVSDASHELRTPVTVIQGYANMLSRWGNDDKEVLDESISAIKGESESMKALLESLLFLTRAEKDTQRVEKALFSLDELIDEVAKETRMIDNAHRITGFIEKGIQFNGDRSLIKQAVRVFIENAMKYTPAGGTITVSCYLEIEENKVKFTKQKRSGHYSEAFLIKLRQAGFAVDFENGLRITYGKKGDTRNRTDTDNAVMANTSAESGTIGMAEAREPDGADIAMRVGADMTGSDGAGDAGMARVEGRSAAKSPISHVMVENREFSEKRGKAVIVVSDTGIGIAPKDIPHIFDRFYRCDESRTRESGGTGLGLSIAKWIIERHLGDITVESKTNVGTRITIRLPEWRQAQ